MQAIAPNHEDLAKDFLRLTPGALKAKYPKDPEVQGALAQITIAREICLSDKTLVARAEHVESEIMRRIALNLAQGLPAILPDINSVCRRVRPEK
ncbi:MAG TPA: hypothetical protein ENH62_04165 [Marinobacter sp.]|uniref:Uncharacterized protein n=2 Tax=root TaxID=1 RepID=A0A831VV29_9GAMM|nr:hypothetical protein [Marinobacter antarcticus]HDZ37474.1 hypothetical protein [Marinobacter sp.]HEA52213.1 hypothetical protein [Marinobacter antarcticus]